MEKKTLLLIAGACGMSFPAGLAMACSNPPPTPPPVIWVTSSPLPNGNTEYWVGIEVDLFPPTATVPCACGVGLSTPTGGPLPAGISIVGAEILIKDLATGATRPVPQFGFARDQSLDGSLPNSPVAPGYRGGSPNATWFGFGATVDAFNVADLDIGSEEIVKLMFHFEVGPMVPNPFGDPNLVTFASGSPGDPAHGVQQFGIVPAPATAALMLTGVVAVRRRRA